MIPLASILSPRGEEEFLKTYGEKNLFGSLTS